MTNDISDFMSWFVSSIVDIFGELFFILDSITFAGTSLLRVLLTILILGSLLGVILTFSRSVSSNLSKVERSEKVRERSSNSNETH